MPRGFLWDIVDYVPLIIDAPLTGRGGWHWGSDSSSSSDFESGILASFTSGDQLLVQGQNGTVYRVDYTNSPSYPTSSRGSTGRSLQNPVQLHNDVISPDSGGGAAPALWRDTSIVRMNGAHKSSRYAAVYKAMVVSGNAPGEENVLRFSVPSKDLTAADSYDDISQYPTSQAITGLAALRSAVLIFHTGSVERMRGSTPAHGTTGQGDLFLEPLFDRVGCKDPRSIAYWNDNCIFADEHGVHITDGAVIRNLVSQGQILYYWRNLWGNKVSVAGCTFLDYYILTIRLSSGPPVTLIVDLNRRQWFRFSNINALTYIASGGSTGMERIWVGQAGTNRLILIGPCFFPTLETSAIQDDDGTVVLPAIETPWYRLAQEGRKRIRFAYLTYDVRAPAGQPNLVDIGYIRSPQQAVYTDLGQLPATSQYTRYRLPVGQFPYGMAFKIRQTQASTVNRLFDIGVEAQPAERSRI